MRGPSGIISLTVLVGTTRYTLCQNSSRVLQSNVVSGEVLSLVLTFDVKGEVKDVMPVTKGSHRVYPVQTSGITCVFIEKDFVSTTFDSGQPERVQSV